MNHLDEGTIHAWLDGAVDVRQSREIEAHVASCVACSAAVAEARGLIAGASRILGALDEVPGGVIPGGGSAAPQADHDKAVMPIATRRTAPRRWRVTQWASGIAAVLVAAIVLTTSSKMDPSRDVPSAPSPVRIMDSAVVVAPVTPAMEGGTGAAVAGQRRESGADATQGRGAAAGVAERDEVSSSAPSAPPVSTPAPARMEQSKGSIGGVASSSVAAEKQVRRASDSAQRAFASDVVPGVVVTSAARDTARQRAMGNRLESVVVTSLGATNASGVERLAGCYRVDASLVLDSTRMRMADREERAPTQQRAARSRAAASSAAAPSAANVQTDTALMRPPAMDRSFIRLDTTRAAGGFTVSRVVSDSIAGSWSVVRDSVRIDLDGRVFMLSPQQKVACPRPSPLRDK